MVGRRQPSALGDCEQCCGCGVWNQSDPQGEAMTMIKQTEAPEWTPVKGTRAMDARSGRVCEVTDSTPGRVSRT